MTPRCQVYYDATNATAF